MGCAGSINAKKKREIWAELKNRVPLELDGPAAKRRAELFKKFDTKGNDSLTEEECLEGCKKHLGLERLAKNLKDINKRAFQASSALRTRADATDGVDPAEFRLYLVNLNSYFELLIMFDEVDANDNNKVTREEFKKALPRMEAWGLANTDVTAFDELDSTGNGIDFETFASWALQRNLKLEHQKPTSVGTLSTAVASAVENGKTTVEQTVQQAEGRFNEARQDAENAAASAKQDAEKLLKEQKEKAEQVAAQVEEESEKLKQDALEEAQKIRDEAAEEAHQIRQSSNDLKAKAQEEVDRLRQEAEELKRQNSQLSSNDKLKSSSPGGSPKTRSLSLGSPRHGSQRDMNGLTKQQSNGSLPRPSQGSSPRAGGRSSLSGEKETSSPKQSALEPIDEDTTEWTELRKRLPRLKTADQLAARDELFKKFDDNGTGKLSLAEVDKGCRFYLHLDRLTPNLSPIVMRAFNTAKCAGNRAGRNTGNADFVERFEFRLFLVYLYDYFELMTAFEKIDTSADCRISLNEFKQAVDLLKSWGISIGDPEETFRKIDTNGGGLILFEEFCDWAIDAHLDVDGQQNTS